MSAFDFRDLGLRITSTLCLGNTGLGSVHFRLEFRYRSAITAFRIIVNKLQIRLEGREVICAGPHKLSSNLHQTSNDRHNAYAIQLPNFLMGEKIPSEPHRILPAVLGSILKAVIHSGYALGKVLEILLIQGIQIEIGNASSLLYVCSPHL